MKLYYPSILLGLLTSAIHGEIVTLAHPEEKLPANSTAVWSPLFQATWDKLNSKLGGPPTTIEPSNALMIQLDTFKWNANQVMPEGSWKTWCGPATQDFLKQVNAEAATLSQTKNGPFKLTQENPAGLASFGLLDREVTFIKSFARCIKEPINFRVGSQKQPVQFFGTKVEDDVGFADSVTVLAFRPVDQSFAIQISSKHSDDKVILYRPAKEQDFASACLWLRTWRSQFKVDKERSGAWNDCFLHADDQIQIPYVDLNTTADLSKRLVGNRYHQGHPWIITRAEQVTRFQLHEKGARVRVEASLAAVPFGLTSQTTPRKFIFDRPFFVFLWRDQAEWPFFGAWIGDASALKAFP
jgi:hypothetical protein